MSTPQDLLQAVEHMAREIGASLASEPILQQACRGLSEVVGADYALVVRTDRSPTEGSIIAEYPARLGKGAPFALEGFDAYRQLDTTRQAVVIEQIETQADRLGPHRAHFQTGGLTTLVLLPMTVQADLLGFILLGAVRPFDQAQQSAMRAIAAQTAVALRNVDLYAEIQRRANQLDQITAFGRLVTGTLDRNQILRHVIEVVPSLMPADQISVALLTPGQSRLRLITLTTEAALREEEWAAAGTSVEEVVQTQNPMLTLNLQSSTYTDHRLLTRRAMRSLVTAPLAVSGRAFGAVNVAHQRAQMYTPTDLTFLQKIANSIAVALENARQFQLAQHHAQYEEALSKITSHLQQQGDLQVLLQQTMQDLGEVLGARRARVRLQVTPSASPGPKPGSE